MSNVPRHLEPPGHLPSLLGKHSPVWKDTLILITEDDPAGGADHVDRRRSFALVVSPWARRGRVSHVRAAFPSLAATWERALGVQPVSRYDGSSEPVWDCLSGTPDERPFTALPSNVQPHDAERGDPGEEETRGLDLTQVDRAPLGPALWKYMRRGEPVPKTIADEADALRTRIRPQRRGPTARMILRATAGAPTMEDDDD